MAMTPVGNEAMNQADQLRVELAGVGLPPQFAKLYSQHVRLTNRRESLRRWDSSDEAARLDDAVVLFEAGLTLREGGKQEYRECMRRAAELLEWLAHPATNSEKLPVRLLAAAMYQLAGYPARSTGLLQDDGASIPESPILVAFLRADFPLLLDRLCEYWVNTAHLKSLSGENNDTNDFTELFQTLIVKETASCLGVFCTAMRWGGTKRLDSAVDKMRAIAGLMNHGPSPYSWLLAKLCTEVADSYFDCSLRTQLTGYVEVLSAVGKRAAERYLRLTYHERKAIAWPSQSLGINRLIKGGSFTICTPTGSGKTTIAELAIIKSLFINDDWKSVGEDGEEYAPLAVYLVPSRALAAEVESKFSRVLKKLTDENVVVTGLYGGADWGPTDAWMTNSDRTILICTYEKSEALMRFLGPLFLNRVRLIVVDEAHTIQYDGNVDTLRKGSNRGLRLESLGMRLFTHVETRGCEVIGLSAVATGIDKALAGWISGNGDDGLLRSVYRSTRQLIGRLECLPNRGFEIHYDLLDGADLQFDTTHAGASDRPFILSPFPQYPAISGWSTGPLKIMRPYLLWAAMHLASPDEKGQRHGVLISISERIGEYANDFLELIEQHWSKEILPDYFDEPKEGEKQKLWERCLRACEDYFGSRSAEYRLLRHGILLHYGRMPGLMARMLVEVIDQKIVSFAIATSTLSEGVNLPFETILIPSLQRWDGDVNDREFGNLVGRAGRPGIGTEGRALVLLMRGTRDRGHARTISKYFALIKEIAIRNFQKDEQSTALSPLAALIAEIWVKWKAISRSEDPRAFVSWLESTSPLNFPAEDVQKPSDAVTSLDTLDSVILSALVEVDQLSRDDLSDNELELRLQRIWQKSYASYALKTQAGFESVFLTRGRAIIHTVYADRSERRRLYRTCLPPRQGNQLLNLYPNVYKALLEGSQYVSLDLYGQLSFVIGIANLIGNIPTFRYDEKAKSQKVRIDDVLAWWLLPASKRNTVRRGDRRSVPQQHQVSHWVRYVSDNLVYRFCWGLGSIVALAVDDMHAGKLMPTKLEDWPKTGLPWIAFWLKELITWGTLDPVAALLLSSNKADTRAEAEATASGYYALVKDVEDPNEKLNARRIRDWVALQGDFQDKHIPECPANELNVTLLRDFSRQANDLWNVVPAEKDGTLIWFDPAGYPLAECRQPKAWRTNFRRDYDFVLNSRERIIRSSIYV
jgi:DEAD/DEAH box helicase